jgi:hypothetical protein
MMIKLGVALDAESGWLAYGSSVIFILAGSRHGPNALRAHETLAPSGFPYLNISWSIH